MADFVPPGSFDAKKLSPISVDGVPLTALNDALRLDESLFSGQRSTPKERYWSTPPRPMSDPTRDIFEVDLNARHIVNSLEFELAHFPQIVDIQYYDDVSASWLPCTNTKGQSSTIVVRDSSPATITATVVKPLGNHPFHFGANHWDHYSIRIDPVQSSRFRLVLNRGLNAGSPPKTKSGTALSYPLGIRSFQLGYKVREQNDIPRTGINPTILTESNSFASTTDLLGSSISYNYRENRPVDVLRGGVWKCEPQPVNYAVVPFYIDARTTNGDAQRVDRLYLDPLYSGAHVNIYYSNDVPSGTFHASDDPLVYPAAQLHGSAPLPSPQGLLFPNDTSFVQIDNQAVQWDTSQPWTVFVSVTPQFFASDSERHVLVASDDFQVYNMSGVMTMVAGTSVMTSPTTFVSGQPITLVAGWDGTSYSFYVNDALLSSSDGPALPRQTQIRFGLALASSDRSNFLLTSAMLRMTAPDPDSVAAYRQDPGSYVLKPADRTQPQTATDMAILRFHPSFLSGLQGTNPTGFVGGPGDLYSDLVWTPINRDYKLRKGFYFLPPTKAKFFKLEFTQLTPQTYDTFQPVNRTIKTFTTETVSRFRALIASPNYVRDYGGSKINTDLYGYLRYADNTSLPPTIPQGNSYGPTEVNYSADPATAARLRSVNPLLGFEKWYGDFYAPRFVNVTKHTYESIDVRHVSKVAYFVGLKAVELYRVSYYADDDTDEYYELFHDQFHISQMGWQQEENHVWTTAPGQQIVSSLFNSTRRVDGVQFATQQTPAVQLLPDQDFDQTPEDHWMTFGDAQMERSDEFQVDIGNTLKVTRLGTYNPLAPYAESTTTTSTDAQTWAEITANYGNWSSMEAVTWGDLETTTTTTAGPPVLITPSQPYVPGGIEATDYFLPTSGGKMYAAARILVEKPLNAPLYLQIVRPGANPADPNDILAEIEMVPTPGSVNEDYVGWNPGDSPYAVTVRLIQKVETGDVWYVDTLSLFNDAILWEFTNDGGANWWPVYDIRNNPHGVFYFPPLPDGDTTGGTQFMYRVTGYSAGLHMTGAAIRPVYGDLLSGIPNRESIQAGGPHLAEYDHYQPIEMDPWFRLWHKPIPIEWWFFYRQFIITSDGVSQNSVFTAPYLFDGLLV